MNKNGNFKKYGRICACLCRFCRRNGKHMDVSISFRTIWRSCLSDSIFNFYRLIWSCWLIGEFALGRMAKTGTLGAYTYCWKNKFGKYIGWLPLLGSLGIAIGYSVILGWVFRSIQGVLTNELLTNDIQLSLRI